MKKLISILIIIFTSVSFAQKVKISGEVFDEYLIPFSGARVKTQSGKTTTTNGNGIFEMKVKLPVRLKVSSDGFITEEVVVEKEGQHISLVLKEGSQLDQVVLSASRTPERIFESPVSVSRLGLTDIKNTPSVNFYNALENIRGVNMYNGSMLYKTVNTRGFTNTTNFRYVQLIDGIDNVFTQTDLFHGNVHGINELDVESVEVLPGASSALYGPNAFNGVILMNSKSPFEYTGISVNLKGGVTTQGSGTKPFYAPSIRMAYKFDDTFAAKINFSIYQGDEWRANDYRDISTGKATKMKRRMPWYNGVNTYNDEFRQNMKLWNLGTYFFLLKKYKDKDPKFPTPPSEDMVIQAPNVVMSTQGVEDEYLGGQTAKSKLFNASLYYRPWGDDRLQIKWNSHFSLANYLYQESGIRYTFEDTSYRQHLLEFKGESFYLRAYHTKTDLGVFYNHQWAGIGMSNHEYPFFDRIGNYTSVFVNKYNEYLKTNTREEAIVLAEVDARKSSNQFDYDQNNPIFGNVLEASKNTLETEEFIVPSPKGRAKNEGSREYGVAKMAQVEGNFDFSKYIKFANIMIGGSYRKNRVDSKGTIFTDKPDDLIELEQYGVYTQIKKNFDRLKLMGTLRYDDSKNFEGHFSPRISANYVLGEERNHNVHFSYQTAFRNPTLENQYIGRRTGAFSFDVGNLEENRKRFKFVNWNNEEDKGAKVTEGVLKGMRLPLIDGNVLDRTGFSAHSLYEYKQKLNELLKDSDGIKEIAEKKKIVAESNILEPYKITDKKLKPEQVSTFELGYRGMLFVSNKIVELDINGYYNIYKDFITHGSYFIPYFGDAAAEQKMSNPEWEKAIESLGMHYAQINSPVNTTTEVRSYGFLASIKTKLFNDFDFGVTYNYSVYAFDEENDHEFHAEFNTPKHSIKTMLGKRKLLGNFGFNIAHRWQSGYLWESQYGTADIEARSVFDAQVSYSIPSLKSRIKIGGNNIAGKEFYTALGTPTNGSIYYISWTIND